MKLNLLALATGATRQEHVVTDGDAPVCAIEMDVKVEEVRVVVLNLRAALAFEPGL
jgi:hypothetical protein